MASFFPNLAAIACWLDVENAGSEGPFAERCSGGFFCAAPCLGAAEPVAPL